MNGLVIILADLVFLLKGPASEWLADIAICVFAADHESDLAGGVGWDGGICVFNGRENFFAVGF